MEGARAKVRWAKERGGIRISTVPVITRGTVEINRNHKPRIHFCSMQEIQKISTELRYKVGPRLRELTPQARGGHEARSGNLGPRLIADLFKHCIDLEKVESG